MKLKERIYQAKQTISLNKSNRYAAFGLEKIMKKNILIINPNRVEAEEIKLRMTSNDTEAYYADNMQTAL